MVFRLAGNSMATSFVPTNALFSMTRQLINLIHNACEQYLSAITVQQKSKRLVAHHAEAACVKALRYTPKASLQNHPNHFEVRPGQDQRRTRAAPSSIGVWLYTRSRLLPKGGRINAGQQHRAKTA
jgi:hypothetical protein